MNKEIKSILGDNLFIGGEKMPIAHIKYKGDARNYVTWAITDDSPALSANDEVLCSICSLDVDIFSEGNYLDVMKEIKQKMKNNDWVWTGDSPEMYEEDTQLYHRTCSFEKERIT